MGESLESLFERMNDKEKDQRIERMYSREHRKRESDRHFLLFSFGKRSE
ncbi:hypothetical protein K8R43_05220 [archaeon]|nr:hypothetical protein [archaeon]